MVRLEKIYLSAFLIFIILLEGCSVNTRGYDEKTIEIAKEVVENYIRSNYEDVKKVEFIEDYSHPMGGVMIRGTVNDGAGFSADMDMENLEVVSLGEKSGFPQRKEECKEKSCD